MRVVFVCSGNICRSPMAEACLRERATQAGLADLVVDSAGTLGIEGAPAAPEAIQALRELGIDLSAHRSRGIRSARLVQADVVVAMTAEHLLELAPLQPTGAQQRFVLRAFERGAQPAPSAPDLEDPIGEPLAAYRDLLRILTPCIEHLTLYLKQRS